MEDLLSENKESDNIDKEKLEKYLKADILNLNRKVDRFFKNLDEVSLKAD